jgi:hypothetical protein
MKEFRFFVDEEMTYVERGKFSIQAESLEDAKKKAIEWVADRKYREVVFESWEDIETKLHCMGEDGELGDQIWDNDRV